ncbi:hypothetical protein A4G26_27370 [Mycobacterium kansasii]|uniref:Antitoxin HicB n=1 Tax=Mycobacterium innocens TaxID=2341083 RepID=A0A498QHJ8_9MYCO|nr:MULTISPECIES: hypothetical protein [Mycobacterium]KZS67021.1 hypothetical protein A4G26_27370 [Mycobacterium kansasii]VBA46885.1 hypothetical protein LAUMK13_05742 [Mycobacterium innocens]
MTRHYKAEITREGRWWMIHIPELDALTQARRIDEINEMARSLIAISTGTPLAEVEVEVAGIVLPGVGDILAQAAHVEEIRHQAEEASRRAKNASEDCARALTKAGIPVRDIATLMHISPQRVSQLTASTP